jgi:hypothetical protein
MGDKHSIKTEGFININSWIRLFLLTKQSTVSEATNIPNKDRMKCNWSAVMPNNPLSGWNC